MAVLPPLTSAPVVQLSRVSKSLGDVKAVHGVWFTDGGEVLA